MKIISSPRADPLFLSSQVGDFTNIRIQEIAVMRESSNEILEVVKVSGVGLFGFITQKAQTVIGTWTIADTVASATVCYVLLKCFFLIRTKGRSPE